jgi:hypothetical protein
MSNYRRQNWLAAVQTSFVVVVAFELSSNPFRGVSWTKFELFLPRILVDALSLAQPFAGVF